MLGFRRTRIRCRTRNAEADSTGVMTSRLLLDRRYEGARLSRMPSGNLMSTMLWISWVMYITRTLLHPPLLHLGRRLSTTLPGRNASLPHDDPFALDTLKTAVIILLSRVRFFLMKGRHLQSKSSRQKRGLCFSVAHWLWLRSIESV